MDNASTILTTLDGNLDHPVRLILYGRAAIQLGFPSPPPDAARSLDVDAIIPAAETEGFSEDQQFWMAQEATNSQLAALGLYITHLFPSDMVILRRDWERHLIPIDAPATRWLRLFRPATVDLVLSKMMRGADALDMADAAFLIGSAGLRRSELEQAFREAVVPPVPELQESFLQAQHRVLSMAID
jgi:hypothetical protein